MRVLLVTPACHFPSKGAVQQDIYSLLALCREHGDELALLTLDQPGQSDQVLGEISKTYQVAITKFSPIKKNLAWLWRAILNPAMFDGSTAVFADLAGSSAFTQAITEFKPEAIVSFGTYSWPVAKAAAHLNLKALIRSHNFEPWHFWEELTPLNKLNPLNWLRFGSKYLSELRATQVGAKLLAISPNEVLDYRRLNPEVSVELLPLVSLINFTPLSRPETTKNYVDLFFLGATYNVPFHRRGAEQLINKIIPAVNALAPNQFRFHILGSKLPPSLAARCVGSCVYEGFVPDLTSLLTKFDAGVFPVWSGRGMKQKIFESLARGFPVVAPKIALGGYPLESKANALVATNYQDLVKQIIELKNADLRKKLSLGAAEFAQTNFNKKIINQIISNALYGQS